MSELALALLAGVATVASPCVLPVLPILLGASWGHRNSSRPVWIVLGFVTAFAASVLVFSVSTRVLGVPQDAVRGAAIATLFGFGLLSVFPRRFERLALALAPYSDRAARAVSGTTRGPLGALALGASLGAVWTPCAGPVLAAILALLASAPDAARAGPLLLAYAAGAGVPMLAIAYGGQAAAARITRVARHTGWIRRAFGVLAVATAIAMLAEYDVGALAWSVPEIEASPTRALTAGEPVPEFAGIDAWLNSPPLRVAKLRGKVVLVDFWTYACGNCVRTLPALKRWHERYATRGLVLIGIHTPEFAFEREPRNVRAALQRFAIPYPVALDNRYATWEAWHNRTWPSLYLVDRDGKLLLHHEGEGGEDAVERAIEAALGSAAPPSGGAASVVGTDYSGTSASTSCASSESDSCHPR
jgi:cytochrome c biogenesis protein CcdA/thiol-disulfide isomerase/thioredoxin